MVTAAVSDALFVHRLGDAIGAEIRGVDLAHVDEQAFDAIERAWLAHQVLLFRGQSL